MYLCENGHVEIVHDNDHKSCPLCEANEKIFNLEKETQELKEKVENLDEKLGEAEETIAELQK